MKKLLLITVALLLSLCLQAQERIVKIKIMQTSDVHGAIFSYNFIDNTPTNTSLAQAYTYIKQQQESEEYGYNIVLLDNGDNLQGQPTVYYYNFIDTVSPHLQAEVMNFMRYDATGVGNHDIEAGHPVYDRVRQQYKFPMLCANAIKPDGEPYFTPYTTFVRNGVKITVLGLITPHIPYWLPENLWSGMQFTDMVESARKWVKIINEKEKPDILIGLFHAGYKAGDNPDEPMNENASLLVAQQIPGFDAVFVGHDHDRLCKQYVNVNNDSVWVLDPANNARYISEVNFTVIKNGEKLVSKQSKARLVDVSAIDKISSEFLQFDKQYNAINDFVSKPIGTFSKTISSRDAYFGPSAFVDLIHRIQLEVAKADISFAAPLSFDTEIKKGTIYVRDMFKLYKYENMLYTMELTGQEVKDYLEFSYGLWIKTTRKPTDPLLLMHKADERSMRNGRFVNPSYNFDSAAGIIYEVDATKPVGSRISILKMANGDPFLLTKKYRVAINSYRGNGGGDHLTHGAFIPKDELNKRIVFATDVDLRYYMMKWIEKQKTVNPQPLNQWKLIPAKWVKAAAKRDYAELFSNNKGEK